MIMRLLVAVGMTISLLTLVACNPQSEVLIEEESSGLPNEGEFIVKFQPVILDTAAPITFCEDQHPAFVMDLDIRNIPNSPEPAVRRAFRDPVFETCVVRVTDRKQDVLKGDDSLGLKNEYSRVQSYNADDSLILVRGTEGSWYIYDAKTLKVSTSLPIEIDPRWDGQDPYRLYYNSGTRLIDMNLKQGISGEVHNFATDFPAQSLTAVWMRYEGSPSIDTRFWGLMAEDETWSPTALLVYDIQQDKVIARLDVGNWPPESREIDSVTISPLGTYFLAYVDKFCEEGSSYPCGLMVYDRNLQNGRNLLPVIGHSDLALDANGREVVVFQDVQKDEISMLDLDTGPVTPLFPIDFSYSPIGFHFSGQAFQKPGWALISTYSGAQPSATWMDDQIFAIELIPGGRVVRLAHTYSIVDQGQEHDYWAEPQASVNNDFTRVLFTSNWGKSGTAEVEMYMLVLPEGWIDQLP
jgi:hypothetical protein